MRRKVKKNTKTTLKNNSKTNVKDTASCSDLELEATTSKCRTQTKNTLKRKNSNTEVNDSVKIAQCFDSSSNSGSRRTSKRLKAANTSTDFVYEETSSKSKKEKFRNQKEEKQSKKIDQNVNLEDSIDVVLTVDHDLNDSKASSSNGKHNSSQLDKINVKNKTKINSENSSKDSCEIELESNEVLFPENQLTSSCKKLYHNKKQKEILEENTNKTYEKSLTENNKFESTVKKSCKEDKEISSEESIIKKIEYEFKDNTKILSDEEQSEIQTFSISEKQICNTAADLNTAGSSNFDTSEFSNIEDKENLKAKKLFVTDENTKISENNFSRQTFVIDSKQILNAKELIENNDNKVEIVDTEIIKVTSEKDKVDLNKEDTLKVEAKDKITESIKKLKNTYKFSSIKPEKGLIKGVKLMRNTLLDKVVPSDSDVKKMSNPNRNMKEKLTNSNSNIVVLSDSNAKKKLANNSDMITHVDGTHKKPKCKITFNTENQCVSKIVLSDSDVKKKLANNSDMITHVDSTHKKPKCKITFNTENQCVSKIVLSDSDVKKKLANNSDMITHVDSTHKKPKCKITFNTENQCVSKIVLSDSDVKKKLANNSDMITQTHVDGTHKKPKCKITFNTENQCMSKEDSDFKSYADVILIGGSYINVLKTVQLPFSFKPKFLLFDLEDLNYNRIYPHLVNLVSQKRKVLIIILVGVELVVSLLKIKYTHCKSSHPKFDIPYLFQKSNADIIETVKKYEDLKIKIERSSGMKVIFSYLPTFNGLAYLKKITGFYSKKYDGCICYRLLDDPIYLEWVERFKQIQSTFNQLIFSLKLNEYKIGKYFEYDLGKLHLLFGQYKVIFSKQSSSRLGSEINNLLLEKTSLNTPLERNYLNDAFDYDIVIIGDIWLKAVLEVWPLNSKLKPLFYVKENISLHDIEDFIFKFSNQNRHIFYIIETPIAEYIDFKIHKDCHGHEPLCYPVLKHGVDISNIESSLSFANVLFGKMKIMDEKIVAQFQKCKTVFFTTYPLTIELYIKYLVENHLGRHINNPLSSIQTANYEYLVDPFIKTINLEILRYNKSKGMHSCDINMFINLTTREKFLFPAIIKGISPPESCLRNMTNLMSKYLLCMDELFRTNLQWISSQNSVSFSIEDKASDNDDVKLKAEIALKGLSKKLKLTPKLKLPDKILQKQDLSIKTKSLNKGISSKNSVATVKTCIPKYVATVETCIPKHIDSKKQLKDLSRNNVPIIIEKGSIKDDENSTHKIKSLTQDTRISETLAPNNKLNLELQVKSCTENVNQYKNTLQNNTQNILTESAENNPIGIPEARHNIESQLPKVLPENNSAESVVIISDDISKVPCATIQTKNDGKLVDKHDDSDFKVSCEPSVSQISVCETENLNPTITAELTDKDKQVEEFSIDIEINGETITDGKFSNVIIVGKKYLEFMVENWPSEGKIIPHFLFLDSLKISDLLNLSDHPLIKNCKNSLIVVLLSTEELIELSVPYKVNQCPSSHKELMVPRTLENFKAGETNLILETMGFLKDTIAQMGCRLVFSYFHDLYFNQFLRSIFSDNKQNFLDCRCGEVSESFIAEKVKGFKDLIVSLNREIFKKRLNKIVDNVWLKFFPLDVAYKNGSWEVQSMVVNQKVRILYENILDVVFPKSDSLKSNDLPKSNSLKSNDLRNLITIKTIDTPNKKSEKLEDQSKTKIQNENSTKLINKEKDHVLPRRNEAEVQNEDLHKIVNDELRNKKFNKVSKTHEIEKEKKTLTVEKEKEALTVVKDSADVLQPILSDSTAVSLGKADTNPNYEIILIGDQWLRAVEKAWPIDGLKVKFYYNMSKLQNFSCIKKFLLNLEKNSSKLVIMSIPLAEFQCQKIYDSCKSISRAHAPLTYPTSICDDATFSELEDFSNTIIEKYSHLESELSEIGLNCKIIYSTCYAIKFDLIYKFLLNDHVNKTGHLVNSAVGMMGRNSQQTVDYIMLCLNSHVNKLQMQRELPILDLYSYTKYTPDDKYISPNSTSFMYSLIPGSDKLASLFSNYVHSLSKDFSKIKFNPQEFRMKTPVKPHDDKLICQVPRKPDIVSAENDCSKSGSESIPDTVIPSTISGNENKIICSNSEKTLTEAALLVRRSRGMHFDSEFSKTTNEKKRLTASLDERLNKEKRAIYSSDQGTIESISVLSSGKESREQDSNCSKSVCVEETFKDDAVTSSCLEEASKINNTVISDGSSVQVTASNSDINETAKEKCAVNLTNIVANEENNENFRKSTLGELNNGNESTTDNFNAEELCISKLVTEEIGEEFSIANLIAARDKPTVVTTSIIGKKLTNSAKNSVAVKLNKDPCSTKSGLNKPVLVTKELHGKSGATHSPCNKKSSAHTGKNSQSSFVENKTVNEPHKSSVKDLGNRKEAHREPLKKLESKRDLPKDNARTEFSSKGREQELSKKVYMSKTKEPVKAHCEAETNKSSSNILERVIKDSGNRKEVHREPLKKLESKRDLPKDNSRTEFSFKGREQELGKKVSISKTKEPAKAHCEAETNKSSSNIFERVIKDSGNHKEVHREPLKKLESKRDLPKDNSRTEFSSKVREQELSKKVSISKSKEPAKAHCEAETNKSSSNIFEKVIKEKPEIKNKETDKSIFKSKQTENKIKKTDKNNFEPIRAHKDKLQSDNSVKAKATSDKKMVEVGKSENLKMKENSKVKVAESSVTKTKQTDKKSFEHPRIFVRNICDINEDISTSVTNQVDAACEMSDSQNNQSKTFQVTDPVEGALCEMKDLQKYQSKTMRRKSISFKTEFMLNKSLKDDSAAKHLGSNFYLEFPQNSSSVSNVRKPDSPSANKSSSNKLVESNSNKLDSTTATCSSSNNKRAETNKFDSKSTTNSIAQNSSNLNKLDPKSTSNKRAENNLNLNKTDPKSTINSSSNKSSEGNSNLSKSDSTTKSSSNKLKEINSNLNNKYDPISQNNSDQDEIEVIGEFIDGKFSNIDSRVCSKSNKEKSSPPVNSTKLTQSNVESSPGDNVSSVGKKITSVSSTERKKELSYVKLNVSKANNQKNFKQNDDKNPETAKIHKNETPEKVNLKETPKKLDLKRNFEDKKVDLVTKLFRENKATISKAAPPAQKKSEKTVASTSQLLGKTLVNSTYSRVLIVGDIALTKLYTAWNSLKVKPFDFFLFRNAVLDSFKGISKHHLLKKKCLIIIAVPFPVLTYKEHKHKDCKLSHHILLPDVPKDPMSLLGPMLNAMKDIKDELSYQHTVLFSYFPEINFNSVIKNTLTFWSKSSPRCVCHKLLMDDFYKDFNKHFKQLKDVFNSTVFSLKLNEISTGTYFDFRPYFVSSLCGKLVVDPDKYEKENQLNLLNSNIECVLDRRPMQLDLDIVCKGDVKTILIGDLWLAGVMEFWPKDSEYRPLFYFQPKITYDEINLFLRKFIRPDYQIIVYLCIPFSEFVLYDNYSGCRPMHLPMYYPVPKPVIESPKTFESEMRHKIDVTNQELSGFTNCKVSYFSCYPINFERVYGAIIEKHAKTTRNCSVNKIITKKSAEVMNSEVRTLMTAINLDLDVLNHNNGFETCDIFSLALERENSYDPNVVPDIYPLKLIFKKLAKVIEDNVKDSVKKFSSLRNYYRLDWKQDSNINSDDVKEITEKLEDKISCEKNKEIENVGPTIASGRFPTSLSNLEKAVPAVETSKTKTLPSSRPSVNPADFEFYIQSSPTAHGTKKSESSENKGSTPVKMRRLMSLSPVTVINERLSCSPVSSDNGRKVLRNEASRNKIIAANKRREKGAASAAKIHKIKTAVIGKTSKRKMTRLRARERLETIEGLRTPIQRRLLRRSNSPRRIPLKRRSCSPHNYPRKLSPSPHRYPRKRSPSPHNYPRKISPKSRNHPTKNVSPNSRNYPSSPRIRGREVAGRSNEGSFRYLKDKKTSPIHEKNAVQCDGGQRRSSEQDYSRKRLRRSESCERRTKARRSSPSEHHYPRKDIPSPPEEPFRSRQNITSYDSRTPEKRYPRDVSRSPEERFYPLDSISISSEERFYPREDAPRISEERFYSKKDLPSGPRSQDEKSRTTSFDRSRTTSFEGSRKVFYPVPKEARKSKREALDCLSETYLKECEEYRRNPESHPEYSRMRNAYAYSSNNPDEKNFNAYWTEKIESLFAETWEKRKMEWLEKVRRGEVLLYDYKEGEVSHNENFNSLKSSVTELAMPKFDQYEGFSGHNIRSNVTHNQCSQNYSQFGPTNQNRGQISQNYSHERTNQDHLHYESVNSPEIEIVDEYDIEPEHYNDEYDPEPEHYDDEYAIEPDNYNKEPENHNKELENYKQIFDAIELLTQICSKLGNLGHPVTDLYEKLKVMEDKSKVLDIFDDDSKVLLELISDKITRILNDETISVVQKAVLNEASDRIKWLLEHLESNIEKETYGLDLDLIARANVGKPMNDVLSFIKAALLFKNENCAEDKIKKIFHEVKKLQGSL